MHCFFDWHYRLALGTPSTAPEALIALVTTHYQFGNLDSARDGIREALQVAQERIAKPCLATILSWMYHLHNSFLPPSAISLTHGTSTFLARYVASSTPLIFEQKES